jgi:hypothetical protein
MRIRQLPEGVGTPTLIADDNQKEPAEITPSSSSLDFDRASGTGDVKCIRSGKRRKRTKDVNLIKLARQKLESKVEVRDGSRRRRLSKGEIGVMKLVNRFVETGDPKIFMVLVEILQKSGGPEVIELPPPTDVKQWTDDEIFEAFVYFWPFTDENRSTNEEFKKDTDVLADSNDPAFWRN